MIKTKRRKKYNTNHLKNDYYETKRYNYLHTEKEYITKFYWNNIMSFIIINEFIECYVNTEHFAHISKNTIMEEFIDKYGYDVSINIEKHIKDRKINNYSHTKTLFSIIRDMSMRAEKAYTGINLRTARYMFFPEFGLDSIINNMTPDMALAALSYYKGNEQHTLSYTNNTINIINDAYEATGFNDEYYTIYGLQEFNNVFTDNIKKFTPQTITTFKRLHYSKTLFQKYPNIKTNFIKNYQALEILEHIHHNNYSLEQNIPAIQQYLNNNNNFTTNITHNLDNTNIEQILKK